MRPRKKFNRGTIIAVIAVLGVSIYLISQSITQNAQESAIKKVVAGYIQTYVSYNMLPTKYRVATPNMPQTEMDSYVTKMESDIKSYFAPGDNSYKFMTDALKTNLQSQKTETTVIYKYSKAISKYTDFDFENSTVTVTVQSNSSYDGPDNSGPKIIQMQMDPSRVQLNAVTTDTVVLKKVDGTWKVAYSNITLPTQQSSLGGGIHVQVKAN